MSGQGVLFILDEMGLEIAALRQRTLVLESENKALRAEIEQVAAVGGATHSDEKEK